MEQSGLNIKGDWNPYVAGVLLGLLLLSTYLTMGFGLGGSAAATRVAVAAIHEVAPESVEANAYFSRYVGEGKNPFDDWMVYEALGVLLGGILAAYTAGRMRTLHVDRGKTTSKGLRLLLAVAGGIIMGFAARYARGCTSGQALTGGAVLSMGSWLFMIFVFVGGYLAAPLVRRQWR